MKCIMINLVIVMVVLVQSYRYETLKAKCSNTIEVLKILNKDPQTKEFVMDNLDKIESLEITDGIFLSISYRKDCR